MPTKQEIINSIATITDSGNNTANKVRTVLTGILNFTENLPPPVIPAIPVVQYLLLRNNGLALNATNNSAKLLYTIKGIRTQFMNMNIQLDIMENTAKSFEFVIPSNEFPDFQAIFPLIPNGRSYVVPMAMPATQARFYRGWVMDIGLTSTKNLSIQLSPLDIKDSSKKGDRILTSIALLPL